MKSRYCFIVLVLPLAPFAIAQEVVVKAAKVYTQTGATLTPGAVRIKDGKIAEVGAAVVVPAGAKLIDLGNGVLIPGLIDAHTSMGIEGGLAEATAEVTPGFRTLDTVDPTAPVFRHVRSEGVTTVAIVPGTDNVISGLSCVVKTAGERQSRIVKADHALVITLASDPGSGNSARNRPDSIYIRQPTNRMGVVWILRHEFSRAKNESAGILREAIEGKRRVICVSRSDVDILAALRLRQEHALSLTIAGVQEAYKVRSQIAAAKVPLLLGPLSTSAGSGPENTEPILNLAGTLHESGIPLALTGGKLLDQARLAVRYGLPKDVALSAVTSQPAKLLGLENRLGTIAVGRDADLVALSGDPFDFTTIVRWTMIDGVLRAEER